MKMRVARNIKSVRDWVAEARRSGKTIGFVPTMGALHAGHGALIDKARREPSLVVVSIFVNPIQFDRKEDFEAYGREVQADVQFCEKHRADLLFMPSVEEMYPAAPKTFVEVSGVSEGLCGAFRPGHFRGVATVVAKLFAIVQPDEAYFGEKDAQQLAVIRRMVADLNIPVSIEAVPTVREKDGLALSSRNRRLTASQRLAAPVLYRSLQAAKQAIGAGCRDADRVKQTGLAILNAEQQVRVEYFEVVDREMEPVRQIEGPVCIAAAIWLGDTRLIDNVPG